MSISESIANFFGKAPEPAPAPAPAPVIPQTDQAFLQSNQPPTVAPLPMDQFKDLFNPKPVEGQPLPTMADPIFQLDPTAMQAAAAGLSFTDSPDMAGLIQAAERNEPGALVKLMESVARNAYVQSTTLSTNIAERAARAMAERVTNGIPSSVVDIQSRQEVSALNPAYSNPALKPMVEAIRTQIQITNPGATPAQIATMTNNYLNQSAQLINPTPPAPQTGYVAPANGLTMAQLFN